MKSSTRTHARPTRLRTLISTMLAPVALLAMVASSFALAPAGASAQVTLHASASSTPCIATVTAGTGNVVSTYILGVTPGKTQITLDCNASVNPGFAVEASLLSVVGTSNVILQNGVDTGALGSFAASATDTGCPAGTAGSCTSAIFSVPASFTAADTNAVCAPSQAQVNAGLYACALVVATTAQAPIAGAEYLMTYAGEPTPASPTITPTVTTGPTGSVVTVSDAAANTSYWWGNALASAQATVLGTAAPTAPSSCGSGGGTGNVPSPFLNAVFYPGTKPTAPAFSTSATGLSISNDCYNGKTLSAPVLSGTLPVPSTLSVGTTYTVYVCELNLTPFPSNDPNAASVCGQLPTGETWIDATFPYTVAVGSAQAPLSVTSTTGTAGTALALASTGGQGTGAVTYVAVNGTATGCTVSSGALSATSAGTCVVTATKAADSTYFAASSTPTTVALAAIPSPKIVTTKGVLKGTAKTLPISITCGPAACSGTVSATAQVKVSAKGKLKVQTLNLGSKAFSLSANATQSVSISLSSAARSYLKANPSHPTLVATVTISGVTGVTATTKKIQLSK